MSVLCVVDKDLDNCQYQELKESIGLVCDWLGHQLVLVELDRNSVLPCRGCFFCFTKHPGICINKDLVAELKQKVRNCKMLIILTPVLFGSFSSVIKNAIDRGLTGEVGLQN